MVYPGTLFHRIERGIPMHSYENRSEIRALPGLWHAINAVCSRSLAAGRWA
jgi:hypothetical protein